MEKNGFRTCLPAILFMCAMAFACATAPSAQTMVYPGFKLEIGEQAKIHNETGLEYADKGFYAEAIEEYKKAIQSPRPTRTPTPIAAGPITRWGTAICRSTIS